MDLTPGCTIGPSEVEAICKIDDHAYRNRWIVYAYYDLSQRLKRMLGDNASFCTFATWSSRTIGEQIRVDQRNSRIVRAVDRLPKGLTWLGGPIKRLQRVWRERADASVSQVMGYGNRLVFHEIAHELSRFVSTYGGGGTAPDGHREPAWEQYRATIEATPATDLFREGNIERLRDGIHCYFLARMEQDPGKRAELVLRGTLLIGSYEQWRVDPVLKAAMSLFPRRLLRLPEADLLRLTGCPGPQNVELRRRDLPWRLRHRSWWRRGLARLYARRLTRTIMNLEIPAEGGGFEELRLGRGLQPLRGAELYLAPLEELRDPATRALFDCFDRSGGTPKGCRARNWSHFDDRMNFIANYFRARQASPLLYGDLPRHEYRVVLDMDVSDARLDALRRAGDDEADGFVRVVARELGVSGRDLLPYLVERGLGASDLRSHGATRELRQWYGDEGALPNWLNDEQLRKGQRFFRLFKVEIATALFTAALPKSYTAVSGAKVLTETADRLSRSGRIDDADLVTLVTEVKRRIAETGQMLLDVMGAEDRGADPFRPGTRAYEAARGVRLFHGAVRHQLLLGGEGWKADELGVPINQEDLLGTLTVFTVVVIEAMHAMGVHVPARARECYVHVWLVVGCLMGIDYGHLFPESSGVGARESPLTYEELRVLMYRVFTRHGGFSVQGCRLQKALLDVHRAEMPFLLRGLPGASVRQLLGDATADDLCVPRANWNRHLFKVLVPFNAVRSHLYNVNVVGWLAHRHSHRLYSRFIHQARGDRPGWRLDRLVPRRRRAKGPVTRC